MGSCEHFKNLVSEHISLIQRCEESGAALNLCAQSVGVKTGTRVSFEELGLTSDDETDDLPVEELGTSLSRVLHIPDGVDFVAGPKDRIVDGGCDENELQPISVELNFSEGFEFSTSEEERLHPETLSITEGLLSSVDETLNMISAMKGSRAKHGIILDMKLSVTWAPEVYDPPVTSESHTLKSGHRQRHKAVKRDYSKSKHSKARVPRRSDWKHR